MSDGFLNKISPNLNSRNTQDGENGDTLGNFSSLEDIIESVTDKMAENGYEQE